MDVEISRNTIWYHGSNKVFEILEEGSTITPWRDLAEAFSHKPMTLSILDDGTIVHNGAAQGYLYQIEEALVVGQDIHPHPRTAMDSGLEFLTNRPLKVRFISHVNPPREEFLASSQKLLQELMGE